MFSKTCGQADKPFRKFERPVQHAHLSKKEGRPSQEDTQVVSFNKFNPSMAEFTQTPHPGPGGKEYDYTDKSSLTALNAAWPPKTPIADRKIEETPYQPSTSDLQGFAAIELKPVFFVVKESGGLTPIPFWQGPGTVVEKPCSSDDPPGPHPRPVTWRTCVLFDPDSVVPHEDFELRDATATEIERAVPNSTLSCESYKYAPVSTIYNIKMNESEAEAFNQVAKTSDDSALGVSATKGDFAVLLAMHVNTKEIIQWTWQTFWWQGGEGPPNDFPGGLANLTDNVRNEWRNYAMCANYSQTRGKGSPEMDVCFNPYLETSCGIPSGITSNCTSCHGGAAIGGGTGYPPMYDKPIDFDNDPAFKSATRTDFSWAIVNFATAGTD